MEKPYVSQKPIYRSNVALHAYELVSQTREGSGSLATAQDLDTLRDDLRTFSEIGLEQIVGDQQVFVNVSRDAVIAGYCLSLSKHRIALEILDDIVSNPARKDELWQLSRMGYKITVGNATPETLNGTGRSQTSFGSTFVI